MTIYHDISVSLSERDLVILKDSLESAKQCQDDDGPSFSHQEGSSGKKYHDVLNPIEYFKMLKQTSAERNIFFSPFTRLDPMKTIGLSYFLVELDRRIVTKTKVAPQIFLWKEYTNPEIQFPLSLNSQKTCIYMDEVYFNE
jgi:hypothetical protein